jgi:hypothetical protein
MIKKYKNFITENVTPESDLNNFNENGYEVKHKKIADQNNPDNKYDVYWGRNAKTNDFLTKSFSGKYAISIGGTNPSQNDIWMHITSALNKENFYKTKSGEVFDDETPRRVVGTHLIIKTIKDDIIPQNVIIQAAEIVRKNSSLEILSENNKRRISTKDLESCDVVFCKKDFVRKENGSVIGQVKVDHNNASYVRFTPGNVEILNSKN